MRNSLWFLIWLRYLEASSTSCHHCGRSHRTSCLFLLRILWIWPGMHYVHNVSLISLFDWLVSRYSNKYTGLLIYFLYPHKIYISYVFHCTIKSMLPVRTISVLAPLWHHWIKHLVVGPLPIWRPHFTRIRHSTSQFCAPQTPVYLFWQAPLSPRYVRPCSCLHARLCVCNLVTSMLSYS